MASIQATRPMPVSETHKEKILTAASTKKTVGELQGLSRQRRGRSVPFDPRSIRPELAFP